MVYQFTQHGSLPAGSACPVYEPFIIYGKALRGEKLTRREKDRIGTSASVKFLGFCAPFSKVFPRFVVNVKNYGWQEVYAADKTAIRHSMGKHNVIEILPA